MKHLKMLLATVLAGFLLQGCDIIKMFTGMGLTDNGSERSPYVVAAEPVSSDDDAAFGGFERQQIRD